MPVVSFLTRAKSRAFARSALFYCLNVVSLVLWKSKLKLCLFELFFALSLA